MRKAEQLTRQELKQRSWSEAQLGRQRKGDPEKVRIALRLRQETTMTLSWIAQRLQMGAKTHLLYWAARRNEP